MNDDANYKQRIDELRAVERAGSYEYPLQLALVGTGVTLAWWLIGQWQLPLWFCVVYGLSAIERYLHRRDPQPYSRQLYWTYLSLGTAIAVCATCLPVYLWTFDEPIYHFGALVYTVGAVLNTFVLRARAWPSLLCYAIPNGLGMVCVAVMFLLRDGLGASSIIALVLAGWITIYLIVLVSEAVRQVRLARETTRDLLQAQKAATLANFAGGVAHDFNNLLGVIYASLERAKEARDVDAQRALLDQGLTAVERGAGLTKQLLTVGRQAQFVREKMHLPTFMQELEQLLLRIIPSSIRLVVRCDSRLQSIESEPSLLQSMLLNLAMNARDALAGDGELEIIVAVEEVDRAQRLPVGHLRPGAYACFSVGDNGKGIPSEIFGRVLEPFFTTRPAGEGTGLGLAMVAGFVQQVEGALDFTSEPGQGTEVRFYLPLEDDWGAVSHPARTDEVVPTQTPTALKVLLVEDQPQLKELLTDHLTGRGCEVRAVSNGDAAYAMVEAGYRADVLLTDVVMSGSMQGAELLRSLQARWPTAYCILMSGYAFNRDSLVDLLKPPDAVLAKPFRMQELDELIDSVLAR